MGWWRDKVLAENVYIMYFAFCFRILTVGKQFLYSIIIHWKLLTYLWQNNAFFCVYDMKCITFIKSLYICLLISTRNYLLSKLSIKWLEQLTFMFITKKYQCFIKNLQKKLMQTFRLELFITDVIYIYTIYI